MKARRISEYVLFFFVYAVIGWIYEVVLETFIYRWGFRNRGVLFGPWLPVYGFGAVLFLLLWYRLIRGKPLKHKLLMLPVIFLATMGTATLTELLTSYLLEWTTGSWPWQTYADYPINFQARIALNPSVRFGLGGILFLYGIQPPSSSWGLMISTGRQYLYNAPWICFAPCAAIMVTVLAFNFLGDGLRDVLDPHLTEE